MESVENRFGISGDFSRVPHAIFASYGCSELFLVDHTVRKNLLRPISAQYAKHQASFYADDVVQLIHPTSAGVCIIMELLEIFGHASGLKTYMQNSSITPIGCSDAEPAVICEVMPCHLKEFPCTYLGLPLTIRKPTKTELQPLIDKVANSLPGWQASLMNRARHLITDCVVLTYIPIYQMIAKFHSNTHGYTWNEVDTSASKQSRSGLSKLLTREGAFSRKVGSK